MKIFPRLLLTLAVLASVFSFALSCLYPSRPLPPMQLKDLYVPPGSPVAMPINFQCTWEDQPPRLCSLPHRNSSTTKGSLLRRSGLD